MEYLKQKEIFWKAQKARVEKYIHYNIQDVESITFKEDSVSPMGVPKLKGYINKDENLWFVAHISTTENFEDDFGCSGELYDNYVKKPKKSVSEIEEEEKKKQ
ncbi:MULTISPECIES: DUF1433 domain-containing protein [unclassified Bacillus cereus group]|uniref:DUF1433 domain-containing protein n=1 Tax=unclassified Bacillus cereus group TaxID=2750818 RepID=UPI003390A6A3